MKKLMTIIWISANAGLFAQPAITSNENSIFWEVSGNGLHSPSYLFGTFHLLHNDFIENKPLVIQKFNTCQTVVGELILDSTIATKMNEASLLKGTTLDQLLTPKQYKATQSWLKELSGYDLNMLNTLNPMCVSTVLTFLMQQKQFPSDPQSHSISMDLYFQQQGIANQKKLAGLETVEDQIYTLYTQFSNQRQVELLMKVVEKKRTTISVMKKMNHYYSQQKLDKLFTLMYDDSFTQAEIENFLDNRNQKWMKKLPDLMQQGSTFVAVGALHLPGRSGLINLLRGAGYTVKPIII
jgi:uncharacterized protein YbaP (TraB family)